MVLAYAAYQVLRVLEPRLCPLPPATALRLDCTPSSNGTPQPAPLSSSPHVLPAQTPPISFPMLVYSHRGGPLDPGAWQENTLGAFRHSAAIHVDLLEMDVQATQDAQVVVVHDKDLGRLCGAAYKGQGVKDFPSRDLPPLLPRPPAQLQPPPQDPIVGPAAHLPPMPTHNGGRGLTAQAHTQGGQGSHTPAGQEPDVASRQGVAPDTQLDPNLIIPLLSQVLREFPQYPMQIDVKVDQPGMVAAVTGLLAAAGPARRGLTLWGSFNHKVQTELYQADPGVSLFTSGWRAILLRLAHATNCMHKVHVYESATIVPWRMRLPLPLVNKLPVYWYPFLSKSWVAALAERGVQTVFFGTDLNDATAYETCLAAGAAGVCTDRPALLQAYLAERKARGAVDMHKQL